MSSAFFAMLFRMKYIRRWALMRNTTPENLTEHALETAAVAHCLATIRNRRFGGAVNADRAAVIGLFHDCGEIITGDLPTPVKYHTPELKSAYKKMESEAAQRMLAMLPTDLQADYAALLQPTEQDEQLWQLCKAADKLTALIKCLEESKMGNREFRKAQEATRRALDAMDLPEIAVFMEEFLPAFSLTLDDLN